MGLRESKQVPEEELRRVTGGVSGHGRQRHCPNCGGTELESYRVGTGWRQRHLARCRKCGYSAGWSSFV